jgi:hypothetical protein
MASQTTNASSPVPPTTNCLLFDLIRHFVQSKWTETESGAWHVTLLAKKPENTTP